MRVSVLCIDEMWLISMREEHGQGFSGNTMAGNQPRWEASGDSSLINVR